MSRIVPAVDRAADILELFLDEDIELTTREVSDRLGLPRATVFELVSTLVTRGYLSRSSRAGDQFCPGLKLFQLGRAYADRLDLARLGQEIADVLCTYCDETVHVAVLDGADIVYVAKVDSTRAVRMASAVGCRVLAHRTAVGKMLLSQLSRDSLRLMQNPVENA